MKSEFKNIEETFKNAFDAFEVDVTPKVWKNVQSSIGSGLEATVGNSSSAVAGSVSKAILLKIVAGIILIGAAVMAMVYVLNQSEKPNKIAVVEVPVSTIKNGEVKEDILIDNSNQKQVVISQEDKVDNQQIKKDKEHRESIATEVIGVSEAKEDEVNKQIETSSVIREEVSQEEMVEEKPAVEVQSKKPEFVKVAPKVLEAKIVPSVLSGKAPLEIDFRVDGDDLVSYLWDFGDNSQSNEAEPYHTFMKPGFYKVSLTVMDKGANSRSLVHFIEVEKDVKSFLETEDLLPAFSPNGDGIGDIFKTEGKHIKTFNARVMNANGKTVFEWNSINEHWAGQDMYGNDLPKGVYYLIIYAKGEDGEEYSKKHSIQLFR